MSDKLGVRSCGWINHEMSEFTRKDENWICLFLQGFHSGYGQRADMYLVSFFLIWCQPKVKLCGKVFRKSHGSQKFQKFYIFYVFLGFQTYCIHIFPLLFEKYENLLKLKKYVGIFCKYNNVRNEFFCLKKLDHKKSGVLNLKM